MYQSAKQNSCTVNFLSDKQLWGYPSLRMYNNSLSKIWNKRKMWLIVPGRMLQAASRAPGEWPGHFWCNCRCSSWHHIMVFVSIFPFSQMSLQSHSTVLLAAKVTSSHSFTGSPEFFWPVSRISFSKKFYVNILLKNYFAYIKYYYRKTCVLERPDASSTLS